MTHFVPFTVVVFSAIEADSSSRISIDMPLLAAAAPSAPVPLPVPDIVLLEAFTG
ncbi:hypothetical protein D3C87_1781310 [compost metagenome]